MEKKMRRTRFRIQIRPYYVIINVITMWSFLFAAVFPGSVCADIISSQLRPLAAGESPAMGQELSARLPQAAAGELNRSVVDELDSGTKWFAKAVVATVGGARSAVELLADEDDARAKGIVNAESLRKLLDYIDRIGARRINDALKIMSGLVEKGVIATETAETKDIALKYLTFGNEDSMFGRLMKEKRTINRDVSELKLREHISELSDRDPELFKLMAALIVMMRAADRSGAVLASGLVKTPAGEYKIRQFENGRRVFTPQLLGTCLEKLKTADLMEVMVEDSALTKKCQDMQIALRTRRDDLARWAAVNSEQRRPVSFPGSKTDAVLKLAGERIKKLIVAMTLTMNDADLPLGILKGEKMRGNKEISDNFKPKVAAEFARYMDQRAYGNTGQTILDMAIKVLMLADRSTMNRYEGTYESIKANREGIKDYAAEDTESETIFDEDEQRFVIAMVNMIRELKRNAAIIEDDSTSLEEQGYELNGRILAEYSYYRGDMKVKGESEAEVAARTKTFRAARDLIAGLIADENIRLSYIDGPPTTRVIDFLKDEVANTHLTRLMMEDIAREIVDTQGLSNVIRSLKFPESIEDEAGRRFVKQTVTTLPLDLTSHIGKFFKIDIKTPEGEKMMVGILRIAQGMLEKRTMEERAAAPIVAETRPAAAQSRPEASDATEFYQRYGLEMDKDEAILTAGMNRDRAILAIENKVPVFTARFKDGEIELIKSKFMDPTISQRTIQAFMEVLQSSINSRPDLKDRLANDKGFRGGFLAYFDYSAILDFQEKVLVDRLEGPERFTSGYINAVRGAVTGESPDAQAYRKYRRFALDRLKEIEKKLPAKAKPVVLENEAPAQVFFQDEISEPGPEVMVIQKVIHYQTEQGAFRVLIAEWQGRAFMFYTPAKIIKGQKVHRWRNANGFFRGIFENTIMTDERKNAQMLRTLDYLPGNLSALLDSKLSDRLTLSGPRKLSFTTADSETLTNMMQDTDAGNVALMEQLKDAANRFFTPAPEPAAVAGNVGATEGEEQALDRAKEKVMSMFQEEKAKLLERAEEAGLRPEEININPRTVDVYAHSLIREDGSADLIGVAIRDDLDDELELLINEVPGNKLQQKEIGEVNKALKGYLQTHNMEMVPLRAVFVAAQVFAEKHSDTTGVSSNYFPVIFLPDDMDKIRLSLTLIHETLHQNSAGFMQKPLNEGMTQYLTVMLYAQIIGIDIKRPEYIPALYGELIKDIGRESKTVPMYISEVYALSYIAKAAGEEALLSAYFNGETSMLKERLGENVWRDIEELSYKFAVQKYASAEYMKEIVSILKMDQDAAVAGPADSPAPEPAAMAGNMGREAGVGLTIAENI